MKKNNEDEKKQSGEENASSEVSSDQESLNGKNEFEQYRLSQDFEVMAGVKKEILVVPVRKPDRQTWFWINPDPNWRMPVALIEVKEDRENYLVSPKVYPDLAGECLPKFLITCQTKAATPFMWPIRMPGADGRLDQWNQSALRIVNEYAGRWIRVAANMGLGAYEVYIAEAEFPPPVFPSEGFHSLLKKAFAGKIIETLDHSVVKMLRGQL